MKVNDANTASSPRVVTFKGFDREGVNWAQFVRITDPAAIARTKRQDCFGKLD